MNNFDPMYKCRGIPDSLQGCSVELIDLISGGRHLVEFWKTINLKEIKDIKKFCKSYKLNFYISNFKFSAKARKKGRGIKIPLFSKEKGYRQIIISDKSLKNKNLKKFSGSELARGMNYPQCCINNYINNEKFNKILKINKKFLKINYLNNCFPHIISNTKPCSTYIMTHIPCSLNCKETQKRSKQTLKNLKRYDIEYYEKIKYFCKLPVIYFTDPNTPKLKEDPPVIIFNGKYSKNKISYDGFISNKNYFNIFKKGNCIEVKDNRIDIFFGNKLVNNLKIKPGYKHHIIIPK